MKTKRTNGLAILAILSTGLDLSGCATCDRHPVACTVGGAILVGSIATEVQALKGSSAARSPQRSIEPVNCPFTSGSVNTATLCQ